MNNNNELDADELNSDKEINDTSAPIESYETEVKQGFFSKLFSSFGRKALPSGNQDHLHVTNTSISSMIRFGSFKARLLKTFETIQKIFTINKESMSGNTLSPHVIGKETEKDEPNHTIDDLQDKPTIIIPKSKAVVYDNKTQTAPNIIDNSESAKDVFIKEDHSDSATLSAEEIDTSEIKDENDRKQPQQPLQIENIVVEDKDKDGNKDKDDEPEL